MCVKSSLNVRIHVFYFAILFTQEKYKRDQEKLQEEWLKAQQEINSSPNKQEVSDAFGFLEADLWWAEPGADIELYCIE